MQGLEQRLDDDDDDDDDYDCDDTISRRDALLIWLDIYWRLDW